MNLSQAKRDPAQLASTAEPDQPTKLHISADGLIRPMRENDLEQVQAIDRLSFSMPWPAKAYRYELKENPNSLLWVAETGQLPGQQIAGMIVVWMILEEAHIATIAVHPDLRGRGIAKELLAVALAGAIQRGAELATLEVRAGNLPAQKLYQRFSFEIVGIRPHYYKDNQEDALIMTVSGLGTSYLAWLKQEAGWKVTS